MPPFRCLDALTRAVVVILLVPNLTYLAVHRLKRAGGVDTFDPRTNFNPFRSILGAPGDE